MDRYYVTFVICDELVFITIGDWCRLSQYRGSINYLITLPRENDESDSPRYGTKRRFDLIFRYNWSRWSLNRSALPQLSTLFLDKRQKNDGASFTCACSTWRMKSRVIKKTYARKPAARFKLDERESNIVIGLQGSWDSREGAYRNLSLFFPIFTFSFRIA